MGLKSFPFHEKGQPNYCWFHNYWGGCGLKCRLQPLFITTQDIWGLLPPSKQFPERKLWEPDPLSKGRTHWFCSPVSLLLAEQKWCNHWIPLQDKGSVYTLLQFCCHGFSLWCHDSGIEFPDRELKWYGWWETVFVHVQVFLKEHKSQTCRFFFLVNRIKTLFLIYRKERSEILYTCSWV